MVAYLTAVRRLRFRCNWFKSLCRRQFGIAGWNCHRHGIALQLAMWKPNAALQPLVQEISTRGEGFSRDAWFIREVSLTTTSRQATATGPPINQRQKCRHTVVLFCGLLGSFLPRMSNDSACRLVVKLASLNRLKIENDWQSLDPNRRSL